MFERFSDRARHAVVQAQEESRLLQHDHIGTEHLLLALLHEDEGRAASALANCGVTLESARQAVVDLVGTGEAKEHGHVPHIPFTRGAKKALEMSLREALDLRDQGISTEHLLLGLLRGDGVAIDVLTRLGVDPADLRAAALDARGGGISETMSTGSGPAFIGRATAPRCSFCGRDLADLGRYVRAGADICVSCVQAAADAIARAEAEGTTEPRVWLPAQVSGHGPEDIAAAVAGIEAALDTVRSDTAPIEDQSAVLEGGTRDAEMLRTISDRWRGRAPVGSMVLQRIAFEGADAARVTLALFVGLANGPVVEGRALRHGERWLIGHDVVVRLAKLAGVQQPGDTGG